MYDYKNKGRNIDLANDYMLAKTLSMFDYEGLPESIPESELERILQEQGLAFIYEWGELYAFGGSLTGGKDVYGRFKEINITNFETNKTKTVSIDEGVLIKNDDYQLGLYPLIEKYNYLLTENEISFIMYNFNSRIQKIISASDDATKESAEQYLKKVVEGELAIIGESPFLKDLEVQGNNVSSGQSLSDMIEYQQYLRAVLYNELGIQANTNNKKERLITAEVEQDQELLYPLVNNMFTNRERGVEKLNDKYNLDITVDYGSVWKRRNLEDEEEENEDTIEDLEEERELGDDPNSIIGSDDGINE